MATLTVRNIPEEAKQRFRQAAAAHGRSMEEHLRRLVLQAGETSESAMLRDAPVGFAHRPGVERSESKARIERLVKAARGVGFESPPRHGFTVDPPDL